TGARPPHGIHNEPADQEVQTDEHEWHAPELEEPGRVRGNRHGFPEDRKATPEQAERDQRGVRCSQHQSEPRLAGPKHLLTRPELRGHDILGSVFHAEPPRDEPRDGMANWLSLSITSMRTRKDSARFQPYI